MALRIEIAEELKSEIFKKFKGKSKDIFKLMKSLEDNPNKGKILGNIRGLVIKELKYKSFRFYFITDSFKLRLFNKNYLIDLLMRFVRMSNKKTQKKTIKEIREVLTKIGVDGFL